MHTIPPAYAYQGFRPWSETAPSSLKPGETIDSRDKKFANVGHGVVYEKGPVTETMRDATTYQLTQSAVEQEHYKVPDKRGVSAKWTTEDPRSRSKPFLGKSMYVDTFRDPQTTTYQGATVPEWVTASKAITEDVVPRQPVRSSYQTDMGMANEKPLDRPYISKTGMAGTTQDLCAGTTKATYHIPGFSGHIPTTQRNPRVVAHGDGQKVHDMPSHLRLYHRHNMPGYTGFRPTNAKNDKGERHSGANPATSSGASALGLYV
uniref:Flagellar associated protein n=1 Tax=Florenciella parvula TaxID=236787 RepID=A0A7S2FHF5_9STRA|mmetsp:Transcript_16476/g.34411  ORF Transcript_16476/g.34411 Transcript_16476/m.34411 type:complete len:262 (+) Transcript_16476:229-1014(+)|eukprot:CAMPEP_0182545416 /NCGR_PEP_ID=MMETSP1323-20130603/34529_1 /TAXON_ID=236787 /ORGANISM="Florenciella parvula, Strain RCC1693" /LENGTH=261 /DNA_ID=CAMNT_0024756569 /DNA_START=209 /DNA_END=994 /DNA_ORIENTATION=-